LPNRSVCGAAGAGTGAGADTGAGAGADTGADTDTAAGAGWLIDARSGCPPNGPMMLNTRFRTGFFIPLALPFAALVAAACSETVREYDGAEGGMGGGPGPASSSTSTGSGGAGGGAGGSGGSGGSPGPVCMPGQPAYAGPLCGAPEMPCHMLASDMLPNPPAFRNDAPAIAVDPNCEPQIAYSVAVGGYKGFHAKRGANGKFIEEPTPFPYAFGGINVGADGTSFILSYAGSFDTTMFRRSGGLWDPGVPLPGDNFAYPRGLARDANGMLHVGGSTKDNHAFHAVFDPALSTWTSTPLGPVGTPQVALAVTPGGTPHLAYWNPVNGMWALHWQSPPLAPEPTVPLNGGVLGAGSQMHSIAVTPDAADPIGAAHILVLRNSAITEAQELIHAARYGGKWSYMVIDQEKTVGVSYCDTPPKSAGEICDYDYEEIAPIGIVASQGGDSIAAYNKVHREGTRIANCMDPMFCYWDSVVDTSAGQIVLATFAGTTLIAQSILETDVIVQSGTAVLDTIGRIHIAVYERPSGQSDTSVRYIQVGTPL